MLKVYVLAGMVCLLSACGRDPDPAQKAQSDARDIAMVEAAQTRLPPMVTVQPQSLVAADRESIKIAGPHCAFTPGGVGATGPMLISDGSRGYVKVDGELIALASDPGGPAMPMSTWARYSGKRFEIELKLPPGSTADADKLSVSLVLRDPYQREVYVAAGSLVCSQ